MKKTAIIIIVLLLSSNIMTQWVSNYWGNSTGDNPILNSKGLALITDSHKDCYVTGYTTEPLSGSDIILIKYNSNGDTLYSRIYSGTGYGEDRAFGIAVDEFDNIYVTGQVSMIDRGLELVVLKYNSSGDLLWANTYGETSLNYDDAGMSIVTGENNKVYVTGYVTGEDGFKDIVTLKLNPNNGEIAWVNLEDGESGMNSEGFGIAVDSDNFIYTTGYITSVNNSSGKDIVVIKYSQNGTEKWAYTYDGNSNEDDIAYDIAIGENDKIFVTGYTTINSQQDNTDVVLIKLNSNGTQNWVDTYNEGSGVSTDRAFGIVVDADNNIYVAGESSNAVQGKNYLILKYNSNGNLKWNSVYNGPGNGDDYANAISLMNNSKIVVTGASWGINQNFDYATLKIKKNNGEIQGVSRYSLSGISNDIAKDVDASKGSTIYVTGYSELLVNNSVSSSAITTLMEKDDDDNLTAGNNIPEKFHLYQNYPNPFNPSTNIKFDISEIAMVKLVIYDILGRTVEILVDSELKAGSYTISYSNSNLSSGIYFYAISTGNYKDVKKMSVIK